MTERTARLRQASLDTPPSISHERAALITDFYQANEGKYSVPVMRARSFLYLCEHKTIYLGDEELIVGERGPRPKAVPTYPELTCHSLEDLRILNSRPKTSYAVDDECLRGLRGEDHSLLARPQHARQASSRPCRDEWHDAYDAGMFTEFMEQRAPGHTVLDDKIYRKGMLDFKRDIAEAIAALDFLGDPEAYAKREQLKAMDISCDAVILFAQRHAELAARTGRAASPIRAARRNWRRSPTSAARAGPRPARFPRSPAVLLVLPPGGDHRTERLGLVQPGPPRPAPAAVLSQGAGRRHADARDGAASCSKRSSSSSTTIPRRRRSA